MCQRNEFGAVIYYYQQNDFIGIRYILRLQLYLRINRLDLAQDRHRAMKVIDEDSPLTGLASAWINMAMVKDCLRFVFTFAAGRIQESHIRSLHIQRTAAEIRQECLAAQWSRGGENAPGVL